MVQGTSASISSSAAITGKPGGQGGAFVWVGASQISKLNFKEKAQARLRYLRERQQRLSVDIGQGRKVTFKAGGLYWKNPPGQCQPKSMSWLGKRQNQPGIGGLLSASDGRFICQAPIGFYEQQYPARENDYRVFVDGVEVTAYIRGTITWSFETTGGQNACKFVLNNNQDAFILTPLNICSNLSPHGWRIDSQSFLPRVIHSEPRYDELAKYLLYRRKYKRVNPGSKNAEIDPETGMWLYPLNPDDCIINKHDPVRVFRKLSHIDGVAVRNRSGKVKAYYDLWTAAFTGFVSSYGWDDDYVEGDRSIQIDCFDYRGLMERMRVRIAGIPLKTSKLASVKKDFIDAIFDWTKKGQEKKQSLKAKQLADQHNLLVELRRLHDIRKRTQRLDCKIAADGKANTNMLDCLRNADLIANNQTAALAGTVRKLEHNFLTYSEQLFGLNGEKAVLSVVGSDVKFTYEKRQSTAASTIRQVQGTAALKNATSAPGPPVQQNALTTLAGGGFVAVTTGKPNQQQATQLSSTTGIGIQGGKVVEKPTIDVDVTYLPTTTFLFSKLPQTTSAIIPKLSSTGDLAILQALADYLLYSPAERSQTVIATRTVAGITQTTGIEETDKQAKANAEIVDTAVLQFAITKLQNISRKHLAPGAVDSSGRSVSISAINKKKVLAQVQSAIGKVTQDITKTKKYLQTTVDQLKALIQKIQKDINDALKQQEQALKRNKLSTSQALDKLSELERRYNEVRRQGAQTLPATVTPGGNLAEIMVNEPTFSKRQAGLFADLIRAVGQNDHPLAGMSYEEAVVWLCCANSFVLPATLLELDGYGRRGKTPLQEWNKTINFGIIGRPLTYNEVTHAGRLSTADLEGALCPFKPLLHMLLPKSGTGARTIVQQDLMANTGNSTSFQYATRKSLMDEISSLINYQVFCNGWGDLVFEFPHYNAAPGDFGNLFKGAYTLEKEITGISVQPESSDLYTAWVLTGMEPQKANDKNKDGSIAAENLLFKTSIIAPILARRLGVKVEHIQLQIPGVGAQIGSTKQPAGGIESLIAFGLMHIQRQLGEAYKVSIKDFPDRPYLLPNRPLWVVPRNKICLTRSVTYTMGKPNGEATVAVETGFTRWMFRDGSFRTILGGKNSVIDYASLYTGAIEYQIKEGVGNITTGNTDRKSSRKRQRSLSSNSCDPRLRRAYLRSSGAVGREIASQSNQWQQYGGDTVGSFGEGGFTPPVSVFGYGKYGRELFRHGINPGAKDRAFGDVRGTGLSIEGDAKNKPDTYQITKLFHNPYPFGEGWNKGNPHFNAWGNLRYNSQTARNSYKKISGRAGDIEMPWHPGADINVPAGKDITTPLDLDSMSCFVDVGPGPGKYPNKTGFSQYQVWVDLLGGYWQDTINGLEAKKFATNPTKPVVVVTTKGGRPTSSILIYTDLFKAYKKSLKGGHSDGYKLKRGGGQGGIVISGKGHVSLPGASRGNGMEGKRLRCQLWFKHNQEVMGEQKGDKFEHYGVGIKTVSKGTVIAKVGQLGSHVNHLHCEMAVFPPKYRITYKKKGRSRRKLQTSSTDDQAYREVLKANNEYLTTQLILRFSGGNPKSNELSKFWQDKFKANRLPIKTVREAVELVLKKNRQFRNLIDPDIDAAKVYTNPLFFFKPEELVPYAKNFNQEASHPNLYSSKGFFDSIGQFSKTPGPICGGVGETDAKLLQTQFTKCILAARQTAGVSYRKTARAIQKCKTTSFSASKKIAKKARRQRNRGQQVAEKVKQKARKSMKTQGATRGARST